MRRVDRAEDFETGMNAAKAEAEAAFGDGRYCSRNIFPTPATSKCKSPATAPAAWSPIRPRLFGPAQQSESAGRSAGAKSPDRVRTGLFDTALRLGRAIGYDSAGTVEFIIDQGSDRPYFLEMNTRLQVEHPVTELITGIDLVEWQLLAAAGEKLPLTQDQIRVHGHAIEARITAERATSGFQPVTGELSLVDAPRSLSFQFRRGRRLPRQPLL